MLRRFAAAALLSAALSSCRAGREVPAAGMTDDAGRVVQLDAPPRRIVSLSPATTELLFDLGAGDRVVGRTELVRAERLAAVVVTHHVNLAARYAHRIVVLDAGEVRAAGRPAEVLTKDVLEQVFQWPVDVIEWKGAPQFVPLKRPGRNSD